MVAVKSKEPSETRQRPLRAHGLLPFAGNQSGKTSLTHLLVIALLVAAAGATLGLVGEGASSALVRTDAESGEASTPGVEADGQPGEPAAPQRAIAPPSTRSAPPTLTAGVTPDDSPWDQVLGYARGAFRAPFIPLAMGLKSPVGFAATMVSESMHIFWDAPWRIPANLISGFSIGFAQCGHQGLISGECWGEQLTFAPVAIVAMGGVGAVWMLRAAPQSIEGRGISLGVLSPALGIARAPGANVASSLAHTASEVSRFAANPFRRSPQFNMGCFVAGTVVATASGPVPIEDIRTGARVFAQSGPQACPTDIDRSSWRVYELEIQHGASLIELETIRPKGWIDEDTLGTEDTTYVEFAELNIRGRAHLTAVRDVPEIAPGRGCIVLSTFTRDHVDTVVDLEVDGADASIGVTKNHRLFSTTRNAWIEAVELHPSERLKTLEASTRTVGVTPREGRHRVYNIEVEHLHTYHVGEQAILAHNDYATTDAPPRLYNTIKTSEHNSSLPAPTHGPAEVWVARASHRPQSRKHQPSNRSATSAHDQSKILGNVLSKRCARHSTQSRSHRGGTVRARRNAANREGASRAG